MAYTKTQWTNGQAPALSAANLNKIENKLESLDTIVSGLMNTLFPVGKVEIFYDNNDHSSYLGFTWQKIATGKALVGIDTNDTDFNTIGKTGGSKYLQKHNHGGRVKITGTAVSSEGDAGGGSNWVVNIDAVTNNASKFYTIDYDGTGNSGNLQPYEVVAIWRRTA